MWLRILLFAIFCSCTSLALSIFSASKQMDKDFREEITISKLLFNNSQDDLYNLHIAKTGGTSFYSDMRKHGIKFKSSEDKNWRRLRHDRRRYLTTIREPLSHVASMYKHCTESKHQCSECMNSSIHKTPFRAWVHYWHFFKSFYNGSMVQDMYERFKYTYCFNFYRNELDNFNCYTPVNWQASQLGIFNVSSIQTRINQFFHINVLTHYDESICVFLVKYQQTIPEECICQTGSMGFRGKSESHGVRKYDFRDMIIDGDHQQEMQEITSLDKAIYDHARNRLLREVRFIRTHFLTPNFTCLDLG